MMFKSIALLTACLISMPAKAENAGLLEPRSLKGGMEMCPSPASVDCDRDSDLTALFKYLSKGSSWEYVDSIRTDFVTFHTQGLYKIGDIFYVSAVEIIERTTKSGSTDALFDFSTDRDAGKGRGWLFKFDSDGKLLDSVDLSDGDIYHPGGIDYDGKYLWVPVAEYRPNSNSNVFKVDPDTLEYEKVLEYPDHIGGIVHNTNRHTLHGVSWGSRRLYEFNVNMDNDGNLKSVTKKCEWVPNPQKYIDYQDCHYQGVDYMVCGGLNKYNTPIGEIAFGGLDLVDLRTNSPAHTFPVQAYIDEFGDGESATLVASNNAYWMEPVSMDTMRMYFMTETKDQADVVIYDVSLYPTTYPAPCAFQGTLIMVAGDKLFSGCDCRDDFLYLENDIFVAQRANGNLIIRKGEPGDSELILATGVDLEEQDYYTRLQADGNLQTRAVSDDEKVWSSETGGNVQGDYFLGLTEDMMYLQIWKGTPEHPEELLISWRTKV